MPIELIEMFVDIRRIFARYSQMRASRIGGGLLNYESAGLPPRADTDSR